MNNYKMLIKKFGSPLYVFNLDRITESFYKLKNTIPEECVLYYSLKANPNPNVVSHLIDLGCYAEVSSTGELDIALSIGTPTERCLYTGPGKTINELVYALDHSINHFSVESIEEFKILKELAENRKQPVFITLRINPSFNVGTASIKMAGVSSQFGINEEELFNLTPSMFKNKYINIHGIHIYNGSNFINEDVIAENVQSIIHSVNKIQNKLSIKFKFIDFGGGFAAPFGKKGTLPNYTSLRERITNMISTRLASPLPTIAFESGRYLTATSGTLIGTVQYVKKSKGKKYCIVDFGINHLGGMSGLGRIPFIDIGVFKEEISKDMSTCSDIYTVVGPLCTPMDYISKKASLNDVKKDDIVYIENVGAYGLSASLIAFLSREIPKEVIVKNNEVINSSGLRIVRE